MIIQGAWVYALFGLTGLLAVWWWASHIASRFLRTQLRAICMAMGLGVAMFSSHGQIVLVPAIQMLVEGIIAYRDNAANTIKLQYGVGFILLNWLAAALVFKLWRPSDSVLNSELAVTIKPENH